MIIYKITNNVTGKLYIGQTTQSLHGRFKDHCREDKHKTTQSYLHRAIHKYGKENFSIEEIDSASTLEGLNILEEHYIAKFNSLSPNGYNLEKGGQVKEMHPDTKRKISETLKGRPIKNRWTKGFQGKHSEETKQKISQALKGRPVNNRWTGGNGAARSPAQLEALRKGRTGVQNHKAIYVVETGEVFPAINVASAKLNIHRTILSALLKTGQKHKKTGFTFKFVDNGRKEDL